jgi:hypothetical protein
MTDTALVNAGSVIARRALAASSRFTDEMVGAAWAAGPHVDGSSRSTGAASGTDTALGSVTDRAAAAIVAEAFAEASVTALALRAAVRAMPADAPGDPVIDSITARRGAELALEAAGELLLAVPSWRGPDLSQAPRAAVSSAGWSTRLSEHDVVAAVTAALAGCSLPDERAADLKATVAERIAALAAGMPDEWQGAPDVRSAGLPLLCRAVADVLLAAAMGADAACSDVALRRFTYRRFGERVPEGLTARHLERSRALVSSALEPQ